MKRFSRFATWALLALLIAVPTYAQQPAPPSGSDPKSADMPTMEMCRQMAGGMMGSTMMSGPLPLDPKDRADMLQMRGEMMKAMGDIMMKHARRMHGAMPK